MRKRVKGVGERERERSMMHDTLRFITSYIEETAETSPAANPFSPAIDLLPTASLALATSAAVFARSTRKTNVSSHSSHTPN